MIIYAIFAFLTVFKSISLCNFFYTICVLSLCQDPKHSVEDLVKGRGSWLSQVSDKTGRLQADLQLGWATTISYIDVGKVMSG